MPLFISINNININNSYQVVKELNIRETNNKKFNNAIKHAMAALIKPLNSIPKK